MENVPKIVTQRLKAISSGLREHPDADLLTAFSEKSLSEKERAGVVEHLSLCGECREVVALSLPAAEVMAPVFSTPRTKWFSWPAMRWAFVGVGLVAIASFGWLHYRRQPARQMAEFKSSTPQMSAGLTRTESLPAAPAVEESGKEDNVQAIAGAGKGHVAAPEPAVEAKDRQSATARGPIVYRALPHGPKMPNQFQNSAQHNANALNNANAANADIYNPQPAAPQSGGQQAASISANRVPAQNEVVMVEAARAAPPQNLAATDAQNQPTLKSSPDQETKMERAKPAQPAAAMQTVEVSGAAPTIQTENAVVGVEGRDTAKLLSSARWTISQTGGLQRSFDQGNTWQDVDVEASARNAAASLEIVTTDNYSGSAKVARAKTKDLAKKQSSTPVFRAVAANGADVWAGGFRGLLYHSPDSGDHWVRVMPNVAGTSLTSDIVTLDFPDAQHGRVVTSNSESWITSNGGQTWQKQ